LETCLEGIKANKKLFAFLFVFLFAITLVSAVPPQQTTEGWIIRSAIPDVFMKQDNISYDFHAHVFDATTGNPVNEDATCSLHIYDFDGTHLFEGEDSVASHDWDYSWEVNENNFTTGILYPYIVQCNGTYATDDEGGFYASSFMLTSNGKEPLDSFTLAVMILLFFVIFVGTIVITLQYFERGVNLEMDLNDVVKAYISFGVFLLYYWFAYAYWGDVFVLDLMETSLWVVGFMNTFVVSIMFGFNILKRLGDGK